VIVRHNFLLILIFRAFLPQYSFDVGSLIVFLRCHLVSLTLLFDGNLIIHTAWPLLLPTAAVLIGGTSLLRQPVTSAVSVSAASGTITPQRPSRANALCTPAKAVSVTTTISSSSMQGTRKGERARPKRSFSPRTGGSTRRWMICPRCGRCTSSTSRRAPRSRRKKSKSTTRSDGKATKMEAVGVRRAVVGAGGAGARHP